MTGLHLLAWFGLSETASLLLDKRNIIEFKISPRSPGLSPNNTNIDVGIIFNGPRAVSLLKMDMEQW